MKRSEEQFGTNGCVVTVAEPTAPKGVLCVHAAFEQSNDAEGRRETVLRRTMFEGCGPSGPFLSGIDGFEASSEAALAGTWALTAP